MGSSSLLIALAALNLSFGFTGAAGVTATLGEDAILPCDADIEKDVTELRWTRLDQYMRLLEIKHGKVKFRHANYTERMYLLDPELKRGNYSLVLKNVTAEDDGNYECKAIVINEHSTQAETHSFSFRVVQPGGSGSPVKLFLPALVFPLLMGMILL